DRCDQGFDQSLARRQQGDHSAVVVGIRVDVEHVRRFGGGGDGIDHRAVLALGKGGHRLEEVDRNHGPVRLAAEMSGPVTLVYGDELMKHHLSDEHPLQPIRVKLTMELITSTGLIEHCHLVPPRAATIEELELVHSPEYVDLVRKLSDPAR